MFHHERDRSTIALYPDIESYKYREAGCFVTEFKKQEEPENAI